jgi:spore coat protein U-like protein
VGISGSANYVKASGDYIYVASGNGGLKIIKMEKPLPPTPPVSEICNGLSSYTSSNKDLILNSNVIQGYYGSTVLNSIIINSNSILTHCGSISVQNNLTLNSNGTFKMNGILSQGKYQQANPTVLTVNSNANLQIEGSVVIWGDLTLNSNSKIVFIGTGSSITVYGKVTKGKNVTITGSYTGTAL